MRRNAKALYIGIAAALALRHLNQNHQILQQTYLRQRTTFDSNSDATVENLNASFFSGHQQHPLCQWITNPKAGATMAPMSIWTANIPYIHAFTTIFGNEGGRANQITADLLHLVSHRLPLSVAHPTHQDPRRLMDRIFDRWSHPDRVPKVKILVMGGSVTAGVNAAAYGAPFKNGRGEVIFRRQHQVRFSAFLQRFLDETLPNVFEIHTLALGGTNSETGATILELGLLPEEATQPDVIIHAFSTNDMHINTMKDAESQNLTHHEKRMEAVESFVRAALNQCPARQPLLMILDDYLGNEQHEILELFDMTSVHAKIASYYGIGVASYANTVRHLVYSDTKENWFSPSGWYDSKGVYKREIHPFFTAHMVMMWVILYNALDTAVSYCSSEQLLDNYHHEYIRNESFVGTTLGDYPDPIQELMGRPKQSPPSSIPPPLNNLRLEHISSRWSNDSDEHARECSRSDQDSGQPKCFVSWVGGLSTVDGETKLKGYLSDTSGWTYESGKKPGFVSSDNIGSSLGIHVFGTGQPLLSRVTTWVMQSYGDRWENSTIRLTVRSSKDSVDWYARGNATYVGFHAKQTSESFPHVLILDPPIEAGDSIQVEYELIGGTTAKITGLALCS